ncbi:MAG: hypothetical protein NVSMB6_22920 [Burkholderiaceae bacterium]
MNMEPSELQMPASAQTSTPAIGSGIVDSEGLYGTVTGHHVLETGSEAIPHAGLSDLVVVRHREHQVMLPVGLFQPVGDNGFRIPFAFRALIAGSDSPGKLVIPVMQEEMSVGKQRVDSGRGVRVHKTVIQTPHLVEQDLQQDVLSIDHVPCDQLVDASLLPQVRYEGDTLVIPVIEEVLVVQKQLRLKEEIRITRRSSTVVGRQTVLLRTEQVVTERFDENLATASANTASAPREGSQVEQSSHSLKESS